jgi:hypothetical protein
MVKCKQCGSDKIVPNVPLLDHYGRVGGLSEQATVEVQGAPQAWVFKDPSEGRVSLSICGECGYAELRVSNARELWEKYQQARGQ